MTGASSDYCLVLLTDRLYLPGTLRAIDSWQRHNGTCPVVVLSRQAETLEDPRLAARAAIRRCIDDPAYESILPYKKRRSRRHAETFYKFEAFADYGFARNVYLDSDLLCLRPAPELIDPGAFELAAVLDTGFRKTRAYKGNAQEINSGALSIGRPLLGETTVAALKRLAREEPGRGGYNAGDQGILNKWIQRSGTRLRVLPSEYNLLKSDYFETSGLDSCRLLHFRYRKPWFDRKGRDGVDRPVAPLERLWLDGEA